MPYFRALLLQCVFERYGVKYNFVAVLIYVAVLEVIYDTLYIGRCFAYAASSRMREHSSTMLPASVNIVFKNAARLTFL